MRKLTPAEKADATGGMSLEAIKELVKNYVPFDKAKEVCHEALAPLEHRYRVPEVIAGLVLALMYILQRHSELYIPQDGGGETTPN